MKVTVIQEDAEVSMIKLYNQNRDHVRIHNEIHEQREGTDVKCYLKEIIVTTPPRLLQNVALHTAAV